eukprot:gene22750-9180_t
MDYYFWYERTEDHHILDEMRNAVFTPDSTNWRVHTPSAQMTEYA